MKYAFALLVFLIGTNVYAEKNRKDKILSGGFVIADMKVSAVPHDGENGDGNWPGMDLWIDAALEKGIFELTGRYGQRVDLSSASVGGNEAQIVVRGMIIRREDVSEGLVFKVHGAHKNTGIADFYKYPLYFGESEFAFIPLEIKYGEWGMGFGYVFKIPAVASIAGFVTRSQSFFNRSILLNPMPLKLSSEKHEFKGYEWAVNDVHFPPFITERLGLLERIRFDYSRAQENAAGGIRRTKCVAEIKIEVHDNVYATWRYSSLRLPYFNEEQNAFGVVFIKSW